MKIEGTNNNILIQKVTKPNNEMVTAKVQAAVSTLVDVVSVNVKPKNENLKKTEETNKSISLLNIASDATDKISDIFDSVKGIVEQVTTEKDITPKKVQILQKEANALLSGMKTLTNDTDFENVKPVTDEEAKIYVEEKIGDTLDMVFPDDVKDGFGMDDIDFSKKETIINTLASVKKTEARITLLKETIAKNYDDLATKTRDDIEVGNKVENLDEAIKLTNALQEDIIQNPKVAMQTTKTDFARFTELLS